MKKKRCYKFKMTLLVRGPNKILCMTVKKRLKIVIYLMRNPSLILTHLYRKSMFLT